jgi:hypothetical protein
MKRQVFLKLRADNYRASLRLEGLESNNQDRLLKSDHDVMVSIRDCGSLSMGSNPIDHP